MYGLTSAQWKQIYRILDRHRDRIHRVGLFGSRARGDYHATSDVDLVIETDQDIRGGLLEEFEQRNLPYMFDIFFTIIKWMKSCEMQLIGRENSFFLWRQGEVL